MKLTSALALTLLGAPGMALAQQPGQQPMQQQQMMRMQHMQETMQHMERVMTQVHQLNQWMEQHRGQQGFQEMGRNMEQACDRLRLMIRKMDQLQHDPQLENDHDRLREMDRLRDRLQDMVHQMDEAHTALRKLVGA